MKESRTQEPPDQPAGIDSGLCRSRGRARRGRHPGVTRLHICLAAAFLSAAVPAAVDAQDVVEISFVADDATPAAAEIRALVREELLALARGDFDVRFPEDLAVTADGTGDGVAAALESAARRGTRRRGGHTGLSLVPDGRGPGALAQTHDRLDGLRRG